MLSLVPRRRQGSQELHHDGGGGAPRQLASRNSSHAQKRCFKGVIEIQTNNFTGWILPGGRRHLLQKGALLFPVLPRCTHSPVCLVRNQHSQQREPHRFRKELMAENTVSSHHQNTDGGGRARGGLGRTLWLAEGFLLI